jgi:hypothetical protein
LIIVILLFPISFLLSNWIGNDAFVIPFLIFLPATWLSTIVTGYNDGHDLSPIGPLIIIFSVITYFIIGSVAGWIYGKFRK